MKQRVRAWLVPLIAIISSCAESVPADPARAVPAAEPVALAADGPERVYSNTTYVEAMVAEGNTLWVATRGGLEQYDVARRSLMRHYTTREGLPSLHVQQIRLDRGGRLELAIAKHACVLQRRSERFTCKPAELHPSQAPPLEQRIEGAAVTSRWSASDGSEWLGTAGLGLWVRAAGRLVRLTPTDQIPSNHVVAITEWNHSSWFASFDRGLARMQDGRFSAAPLGARMLNDVIGTRAGLFVASSEGLYRSTDGEVFQREPRVLESAIVDLAYDDRKGTLYVAATNSLWELALDQPHASARVNYRPGGSRALQAVDVGRDGAVFLASEDRGALERVGKRRFVGYDRLAGYPSSWAVDVLALDRNTALVASLRHGVFAIGTPSVAPTGVDPWILFLGRDPADPNTVFIGTQGGAVLANQGSARTLLGLPHPCVHAIARLSDGLWVGTEGGLALYGRERG